MSQKLIRRTPAHTRWKTALGIELKKQIIKYYGEHRVFEFAQDIGVSQGSVSEIVNGISAPSSLTLKLIDQFTEINVMGLLRVKY